MSDLTAFYKQNTPKVIRVVGVIVKVSWVITLLLTIATVFLVVSAGNQSDNQNIDAANAAGFLGIVTGVFVVLSLMFSITMHIIWAVIKRIHKSTPKD